MSVVLLELLIRCGSELSHSNHSFVAIVFVCFFIHCVLLSTGALSNTFLHKSVVALVAVDETNETPLTKKSPLNAHSYSFFRLHT